MLCQFLIISSKNPYKYHTQLVLGAIFKILRYDSQNFPSTSYQKSKTPKISTSFLNSPLKPNTPYFFFAIKTKHTFTY